MKSHAVNPSTPAPTTTPLGWGFYLGFVVTLLGGLGLLNGIDSEAFTPSVLLLVFGLYLLWSGWVLRPTPFRIERDKNSIRVFGTTKQTFNSWFFPVSAFFMGLIGLALPNLITEHLRTSNWLAALGLSLVELLLLLYLFVIIYYPFMARWATRAMAGPSLELTEAGIHFHRLLPSSTLPLIQWDELAAITPYQRRESDGAGGSELVKLLGLHLTPAGRTRILSDSPSTVLIIRKSQSWFGSATVQADILLPAVSLVLPLAMLLKLVREVAPVPTLVQSTVEVTETATSTQMLNWVSRRFLVPSARHPIAGWFLRHRDED